MLSDPGLAARNLHLAVFAMALMLRGQRRGIWALELVALMGTEGQFRIRIGGRALSIYILSGSGLGAVRLEKARMISLVDAPDVVVLYPDQNAPPKGRRSPLRSRTKGPAEIWLRDLIDSKVGIDRLVDMLKLELLAAR
jgi:hypothetical protein